MEHSVYSPNFLLGDISIFVQVMVSKTESFIRGVIYRLPALKEDENKSLNVLLELVSNKYQNHKCVITGDFNYSEIDWPLENCRTNENYIAFKFLNTVQKNVMTQFVKEPSHYRCLQTPTLIDLILANDSDLVNNVKHFPALGLSHQTVI